MNAKNSRRIALCLAAAALAGSSPGGRSTEVEALVDPLVHRSFADELTANLHARDNECSSALGVSMALSLIYPASTGEATTQLREVLGYPQDKFQLAWSEVSERMVERSSGQCLDFRPAEQRTDFEAEASCHSEAPVLKIANGIWLDDNSTLNAEYAAAVGNRAMQIDLEAIESPLIVNKWVEKSTNGLIDSVVDEGEPLYPPSELVAVNSFYLKAAWKHQFRPEYTNLDAFYANLASKGPGGVGASNKAHFMNAVEHRRYSHDALPSHQVVQLPFANSDLSAIVALPRADDVPPVKSADLLPALQQLNDERVALSLPKFKFASEYDDDLKAAAMKSGIYAPFEWGSLCDLFVEDEASPPCATLFVNKVVQKTVVDVHELGVEAAAVTAVHTGRSAPHMDDPVKMIVDRPFQFFVYDGAEDLILFEGRVGDPGVPEGEPTTPLLDATRGGEGGGEFWREQFQVDAADPPAYVRAEPTTSSASSVVGYFASEKCFTLLVGALLAFALGFAL